MVRSFYPEPTALSKLPKKSTAARVYDYSTSVVHVSASKLALTASVCFVSAFHVITLLIAYLVRVRSCSHYWQ